MEEWHMSESNMKKLGFGLMRLPNTDGKIDRAQVMDMVDLFLKRGFTYFDTAYIYGDGESERVFRETVVERYPRDAYTITDKIPCMNLTKESQLEGFVTEMLNRLGVEYFDYLWLHAINDANYEKMVSLNAFEYLKAQKENGRARNIGMSYHGSAVMLDRILADHPEIAYVQLQINYCDWTDTNIQSRDCYEVCVKNNKPVIVMEPVKGGSLQNLPAEAEQTLCKADPASSNASYAIRFAASLPQVMVVLSGMSGMDQTEDNTSFMEHFVPLTDEEHIRCVEAGHILRKKTAIACTACRYCTSQCPKKIAIPDYFSVYNNLRRFGMKSDSDIWNYFLNLIKLNGRPSECIKCGLCEARCPQKLPIRTYLEKIGQEVEARFAH